MSESEAGINNTRIYGRFSPLAIRVLRVGRCEQRISLTFSSLSLTIIHHLLTFRSKQVTVHDARTGGFESMLRGDDVCSRLDPQLVSLVIGSSKRLESC